MDIRKELIEFISSDDNNGALLLTGKWGIGKTYLVKEIVSEINEEKVCAIAVVSLFGIDNVSLLHERIKDAYLELYSVFLGKTARGIYGLIRKLASDASKIASEAMPESTVASAISTGVTSVFSYDPIRLISVTNTIGIGDSLRTFAIVFDDFERRGISIKQLMGVLNEYSENRGIKTIVIADEEKIEDAEYWEFKEKVIARTLKLNPDHTGTIREILNNYSKNDRAYKEFLQEHESCLLNVFFHSGYNNLRTLKACLFDFWRIYKAWKTSTISMDHIESVLYKFCAMEYEVKKGNYGKSSFGGYGLKVSGDTDEDRAAARKRISEKYLEGTFDHIIVSIAQWIVEGEWDEAQFIEDIRQRYAKENVSHEMKFANYDIWSLQQEDIDQGMPGLVARSYRGDATCDELISLLQKVHFLKKKGVSLPCEIDYEKIEKGFEFRQSRIRTGEIEAVKRRTFADTDTIDEEAVPLYKKIESMRDKTYAWSNRSLFVAFLGKKGQVSSYVFTNRFIDAFDDELFQLFIEAYGKASNGEKRDLCRVLLGLDLNDDHYSSQLDKQTSKRNLEKLISEVERHADRCSDKISALISKSFIEKLKDKISLFDTPINEGVVLLQ